MLRGYILRAYPVWNSSIRPVEMGINEITIFNSTLSGLEPYTLYDVRVAAFTNGGTGESPGARTRTLESGTLIVCPTYNMNYSIREYWATLKNYSRL